MSDVHHKRLRDWEAFDKITFTVVPRWKTSGLSGDEWRQHVEVEFFHKGEVVHREGFGDMKYALMLAPGEWIRAQEPIPERVIEIERALCDQPSCEKAPDGHRYVLKRETARDGRFLDPADLYSRSYRQFCAEHAHRGDCSREDADENYEKAARIDGKEPGR